MKTKLLSRISSFIILLVMCVLTLAGCTGAWVGPDTNDAVVGNGSIAVQKGEYLYFVNGYTSVENMVSGDNKGNVSYSGLYRAKLDENNNLSYDEDGNLKDVKKIISKVCGYDNTALYIFGDYIYYSTPYADKVKSPDGKETVNNFKLTEFYKAKLDGSDVQKLYTTTVESDQTQFAYYQPANTTKVSLAIYDGSKLMIVDCNSKAVKVVSEDVQSVAMPKVSNYNASNNQTSVQETTVFYTRNGTEDEELSSGNVLAYVNIGENEEQIVIKGDNTYTVKFSNKDALVLTIKGTNDSTACNYFATFDADGELSFDLNNVFNQQLDYTAHEKVYLAEFEEGNPLGIITTNSNKNIVFLDYSNGAKPTVLNQDLSLTPLCMSGNYVYAFSENNSLYRVNYKNALVAQDKSTATECIYDSTKLVDKENVESETVKQLYFEAKTNFAVIGNNVFFYVPYEGENNTGYYLNKINLLDAERAANLVGVVQNNHIIVEDEE